MTCQVKYEMAHQKLIDEMIDNALNLYTKHHTQGLGYACLTGRARVMLAWMLDDLPIEHQRKWIERINDYIEEDKHTIPNYFEEDAA